MFKNRICSLKATELHLALVGARLQLWSCTLFSLPGPSPKALMPNTTELMLTQTSMTERMISRELMPFTSPWKETTSQQQPSVYQWVI